MDISSERTDRKLDWRRTKLQQTIAYFAAFVALGLTTGSLGPTLPSLADQTKVGLSAISYVFTARSLGYVIGSVRAGKLLDGRPGNPLMAALLLLMSLMMAVVPLVPVLSLLLLAMFLLGVAEAGVDVGANTMLGWVHRMKVAPFMNALHSFFGVGALIAPLVVAGAVSFNLPATHSYFALAVLLLPVSLFILRLPSPAAAPQTTHRETSTGKTRHVFLIALFLFLYVGAEVGFVGWIFTYSIELRLSDVSTAAYLTSLFWGSLTLGRVLAIPVAARFEPQRILVLSMTGCILSLAIVLLRPGSFSGVLISTIALGLSMASIFPTTLSFAGKRMRLSGRVTGWFVFGASAGSMLVPLAIGQAFQAVGPKIVIIVTIATLLAAFAVLTAILHTTIPGETNYSRLVRIL